MRHCLDLDQGEATRKQLLRQACRLVIADLGRTTRGIPMVDPIVVDLSRIQFAATAMYHFLFVPLTLGLSLRDRPSWRAST
jgi:hypothetical protein